MKKEIYAPLQKGTALSHIFRLFCQRASWGPIFRAKFVYTRTHMHEHASISVHWSRATLLSILGCCKIIISERLLETIVHDRSDRLPTRRATTGSQQSLQNTSAYRKPRRDISAKMLIIWTRKKGNTPRRADRMGKAFTPDVWRTLPTGPGISSLDEAFSFLVWLCIVHRDETTLDSPMINWVFR